MKIASLPRLFLSATIATVSGCAQKTVTAPPPPAPAAAKTSAATVPAVQPAPPAPSASSASGAATHAENQRKLQDLLTEALKPVYFDYDQSEVKPDGKAILGRIGALLKQDKTLSVTIEGNTDERGSTEYNLALGDRRANTARKWLLSYGISKDQLKTVSYGKEKPAADGHDEASWSKNRRDDFASKSL
jgi:peptidoglycan-associated lipoprotein